MRREAGIVAVGLAIILGALILHRHLNAGLPAGNASAAVPPDGQTASSRQSPGANASSVQSGRQATPAGQLSHVQGANSLDAPRSALEAAHPAPINRKAAPYYATLTPAEATVLSEEINGRPTYQSDSAEGDAQEAFSLKLEEAMRNATGTSSRDLLAMFQSEENPDNKMEILVAANALDSDANTRSLLEQALANSQPQALRIAAVNYAADHAPSLLASYVNDPDPDVGLEARDALERSTQPSPSTIIAQVHTPPQNLARPPETINLSHGH